MKVVKECLFAALLFVGFISSATAQSSKTGIKVEDIEIAAVSEPLESDSLDNRSQNSTSRIKWAALFVRYNITVAETKESKVMKSGNWADSVELKWEMATKLPGAIAGKPVSYRKFSRTVKYKNIKEGKHVATVLIEPAVLERYFEKGKTLKKDLKVKFSAKVNGRTVKGATTYLVEGKVDNRKAKSVEPFITSEDVKMLEDILLTKNETPFRNVQSAAFDRVVEDK